MKRFAWIACALILSVASASAYAQNAYVTANLNLRSAPDPDYPLITTLRAGTPVSVQGCIDDFLWCDVIAYGDRGWVAGDYLEYEYDHRRVLLPSYGTRIGIPIISFVIGDYWSRYYSHRSFYSHRNDWYHRPIHYRYARHDRHDRWDDRNDHGRHDRHDGRADIRHDRRDVRHEARNDHHDVRQNVRTENRETRVVRHDNRQAVPVARRASTAQAPRAIRSGENSGVRAGQRDNAHAAAPRQQVQHQAAPQRASSERKSRPNGKDSSDKRGDHDKGRH